MRVFKTIGFDRFTKKQNIGDEILRDTVEDAELGIFDAELGGNLFKSRIYMDSKGNRKRIRVLFAFKSAFRTLFMRGFSKSRMENLKVKELSALKILAKKFFDYKESELDTSVRHDKFKEIEK